MSETVLTSPIILDATGQDMLTKLDSIISAINPVAQGVSYDNAGTGMVATNVQSAITELKTGLVNTNSSLTQKTLASVNFQNTTTNFEYTGLSFTIPNGKVCIVEVRTEWISAKPTGLVICSTSTNINNAIDSAESGTSGLAINILTTILGQGTYYLWSKRGTVPSAANPYTVKVFELS